MDWILKQVQDDKCINLKIPLRGVFAIFKNLPALWGAIIIVNIN